jgi:NADP-dependent 3-hydroxy acid dehydrogenase YdfG
MADLAGQVALITGASSGIGVAIAQRLAQRGCRVALCARRGDRLAAVAEALRQGGAEVIAQPTDLRQEADILRLFDHIRQTWGGVDILVNNAGLGHNAPLMTGATEAWREMLEVNVLALCICTREALSDMQARGDRGHIVHISSLSGHRVPSISGLYSGTKFAVRSLTEGLRQELRAAGSAIRISSVSPGYVETEFAEKYHQDAARAAATYSRFPVLTPDDIANAVDYLLSQPPHVQVHDILLRPTQQDN